MTHRSVELDPERRVLLTVQMEFEQCHCKQEGRRRKGKEKKGRGEKRERREREREGERREAAEHALISVL